MISYESNDEYSSSISRYRILRVILDNQDKYMETQNQKFIPKSSTDIYHSVLQKEVDRLDIISNEYYGTPQLWWAIALANMMIDPFDVPKGTLIRIPPKEVLYDFSNEILERVK